MALPGPAPLIFLATLITFLLLVYFRLLHIFWDQVSLNFSVRALLAGLNHFSFFILCVAAPGVLTFDALDRE